MTDRYVMEAVFTVNLRYINVYPHDDKKCAIVKANSRLPDFEQYVEVKLNGQPYFTIRRGAAERLAKDILKVLGEMEDDA